MTDRLEAAKSRIEKINSELVRSQYQFDQATEEIKKLVGSLKEDYGVSSIDEARQHLQELSDEYEKLMSDLEEALKEIE